LQNAPAYWFSSTFVQVFLKKNSLLCSGFFILQQIQLMKNTVLLFAALFLALVGWNCGAGDSANANSGSDVSNNDPASTPAKETEKPVTPRMQVMVDDLRVRKGPGKDAEVVGELKEGQFVEYLGESSRMLEEVTLRGKKIKAPWMKVRLPSGGEGWVFGGAIEDEKTIAEKKAQGGSADQYRKYLGMLSGANCENVKKAAVKLKKDLASDPVATQDDAIRAFYDFYKKLLEAEQNVDYETGYKDLSLFGYNPEGKPISAKARAKRDEWKQCGIDLDFPEGNIWPVEDHRYMYDQFGTLGTPAMQAYLKQIKTDLKEGFSADAGLRISPKEFGDRIVAWQQFRDKYPGFKMLGADLPGFQEYIAFFMTGLDNTPAFDWGGENNLNPEWKTAYESVMSRIPNTEAGKAVKDYYALLKKNGWKRTDEVIAYSSKYWGQHVID
jgi:uncharacterized protein YgiM (DUF1202 family)